MPLQCNEIVIAELLVLAKRAQNNKVLAKVILKCFTFQLGIYVLKIRRSSLGHVLEQAGSGAFVLSEKNIRWKSRYGYTH